MGDSWLLGVRVWLAVQLIVIASTAVVAQERGPALAFDREQGFRAQLVNLRFAERVEGTNRSLFINEDRANDYRLGIATVRIDKPAGTELTLACADVTLHYYHSGNTEEVAACQGMSGFSTVQNTDRPLDLRPADQGPGFLKKSTLEAATAASVVFVDVLFTGMESSTADAWIAIGRVDAPAPFHSDGWRGDTVATCTDVTTIGLGDTTSGSWDSSCRSSQRSGRYARFYSFALTAATTVRIDLEASEDSFLYLLRGAGTDGEPISSDDDGGDGSDARLTQRLEPGSYTIEATSYEAGKTGRFTLHLATSN